MTELPAFLEVMNEQSVVARVPSSDGTREYVTMIVYVPNDEARWETAGGRFEASCRCKGWRLGVKDGSYDDWCKHIRSTFEEWAEQKSIQRRAGDKESQVTEGYVPQSIPCVRKNGNEYGTLFVGGIGRSFKFATPKDLENAGYVPKSRLDAVAEWMLDAAPEPWGFDSEGFWKVFHGE